MDGQQGLLDQYYASAGDTQSPSLSAPSTDDTSSATQTGDTSALDQYYNNTSSPAVEKARSLVGNTDYNGWCESFVEQMLGLPKMGGSAAEAWNNQLNRAASGISGAKPGDPIYFAPDASNEGYGHAAIYAGNGKMISATDNGVAETSIADWEKETGQQLLGHVKL